MSSLPPANSPVAATISWPLQPSLPPPPVDDITTPPPLLPIIPLPAPFASPPSSPPVSPLVGNASPPPLPEIAPFVSPPSPPTTSIGVLLPPVNSVPPPIATPPLTSPAPIIVPIIISPPPLKATSSTPIIPVKPPLPSVTSPPFPTSPLSLPPPPSPLPPKLVTSLPPLSTPSPLSLSPPPPPAGTTPSTILSLPPPTPIRPNYPPTPTSAFPLAPPTAPTSTYAKSQPLPLPLANGSLPVTSKQSHIPIGLTFGCIIGGVFLLLVFGLIFICNKNSKSGRNHKNPSLESKDNSKTVVNQDSAQNGWPQGAHVIRVETETFSLPPASTSNRGSVSMTSGLENPLPIQAPFVALSLSSGTFTYDELVSATNGFSEANLIGEGGFGYVHKGLLRSGQEVAVKQLKEGSRQGEREFRAEVEIINQVHHKHLVSLIGYCIAGIKRLLVYEFVPNNTLQFHLHGNGQPVMDWDVRLKIAIGSAKGLAYLHEDCNPIIIHRDIKAANILLDHKFEAKVSDFGLARSFSDARTSITHISTLVVGTFGYLAPEYASSGKVTKKSDVYSYGVMLLELITGRPPISDINFVMKEALVTWARPLLTEALEHGNFEPLVDRRLENNYNTSEMTSMIACAAGCIRHSSWLRPRMNQIVRALEGDILAMDLIQGKKPGHSTLYGSTRSSNYDAFQYKQDGKKHNMALASGYSGTTREYGLNPSSSSSDFTCRQTNTRIEPRY